MCFLYCRHVETERGNIVNDNGRFPRQFFHGNVTQIVIVLSIDTISQRISFNRFMGNWFIGQHQKKGFLIPDTQREGGNFCSGPKGKLLII